MRNLSEKEKKIYLFETMPLPRALASLSIPMVISSLVGVFYNIADTYFVGMLSDPVQNAAVTLIFPITLAFNAVVNLFGIGSSSMMSRCLGYRDYDRVRTCSAFGFYGALLSGLLFSLLSLLFRTPLLHLLGADGNTVAVTGQYMFWTVICGAVPAILGAVQTQLARSEGAAVHASIGSMLGCIVNMILDPIFILYFDMKAAGAGIATFLSSSLVCVYFLLLTWHKRGNTFVCLNPRQLRHLDRLTVRGILAVGIPCSIQNLLNVASTALLTRMTASYGAAAVAAMGISQKIRTIPFQVSQGFSQGVMPLISYNYASGDRSRMKRAIVTTLGVVVPSMTLAAAVCWIHSEGLIRLFLNKDEILLYGIAFLHPICVAMPFLSIDSIGMGIYQALGYGRFTLALAVIRKAVLEIPLLFLLTHFWDYRGLTASRTVAEVVMAALALTIITWICRQKAPEKSTD